MGDIVFEEGSKPLPFRWGRVTRVLLLSLPTVFTVVVGLCLAEWIARARMREILSSDDIDTGLISYDETLGWKLTPNWSGQHRHHDYIASYHTNEQGFRADSPDITTTNRPIYAVLGDSFVFGFGVNDSETFVHDLNHAAGATASFVNFGVPGYSTDQEVLLLDRKIARYNPDTVLLVVYLGNDLLDNPRLYPVQASRAKPCFVLVGDQLDLRNTPVPRIPGPANDPREELRKSVLGPSSATVSFWSRLFSESALLSPFQERFDGASLKSADLSDRLGPMLTLFEAIINRANSGCTDHGIRLSLVLIGGRSFVEAPQSSSAKYQAYFRENILDWSRHQSIVAIDAAGMMRDKYALTGEAWFFKNDGHLNPRGHSEVAEILASNILRRTLEKIG